MISPLAFPVINKIDSGCYLKFLKKNTFYAVPTSSVWMLNGSYYLIDNNQNRIAVYKPRCQVQGGIDHLPGRRIGQREGVPVGSEIFREKLAYSLSMTLNRMIKKNNIGIKNFGIPKTKIKAIESDIFGDHHETGSWQKCKKNYRKLITIKEIQEIPKNEIFKIALIDMLFLNTDRHMGNILYSDKKKSLALIDHGSCFPEFPSLHRLRFIWSASLHIRNPFPEKWIAFILNINTEKYIKKILLEVEKHENLFPNQQMEISTEALFNVVCAIESLKKFAKERKIFPIEIHVNYLLGGRFAIDTREMFFKHCTLLNVNKKQLCIKDIHSNFELIRKMFLI